MDSRVIVDGVITVLQLIVLLTFHEFGHAWMAWRCGDDTAKQLGRVSLNPLAHIDLLGTIVFPLIMVLVPGAGRLMVGWAKPVPVNPSNLRNPKVDDILVTLAGPWMNLLLAVVLMGLARIGLAANSSTLVEVGLKMASLSLTLCFFNLIPIPPLDGSQVVRSLVGMSYEMFNQLSLVGMAVLLLVLQIPFVRYLLGAVTHRSFVIIGGWFGIPLNL
jgi:Zn-dependent protease